MDGCLKTLVAILILVILFPVVLLTLAAFQSFREVRHRNFNDRFVELMPKENRKYFLVHPTETGLFEFAFDRVLRVNADTKLSACVADGAIDWDCLAIKESEDLALLKVMAAEYHWKVGPLN